MWFIWAWIVRESFFSRRLTAASFGSIKRITAVSPSLQHIYIVCPHLAERWQNLGREVTERECAPQMRAYNNSHKPVAASAGDCRGCCENKSPTARDLQGCQLSTQQLVSFFLRSIGAGQRTIKKWVNSFFLPSVFTPKFNVRRHVLHASSAGRLTFFHSAIHACFYNQIWVTWLTVNS